MINYACKIIHGMLDIVLTQNMISNIGANSESVHSSEYHYTPKGLRVVYNAQRFQCAVPFDTQKIIELVEYYKAVNSVMGWGGGILGLCTIESGRLTT